MSHELYLKSKLMALGSFIIHNQLLRLIINYYVYYCVLYGRHTLGNRIDPDQETKLMEEFFLGTFRYSL